MEIPEAVNDYVDALARADVDACASAFAPDGIYTDPEPADCCRDKLSGTTSRCFSAASPMRRARR
jgi:ketosteroid isomerase-like protein